MIAEDVALLISDRTTPRRIGIPVRILGDVIQALQTAQAAVRRLDQQLVTPLLTVH
ncbi:hypothetical protein [Gordonia sp. CPCC 205333]|uniref:hypothetical protein n=1 Tax=Gordonia sp. CPCC 205333 TaxID=3140790 RepID=UPI003AF3FDFE